MPIIRKFEIGKLFHIYSRGVEKRDIFLCDKDFWRFFDSVFFFNSVKNKDFCFKFRDNVGEENIVFIDCFTLMPNHFHMILKEITKGGISKFMQKLITSYTMYFNEKYSRFGSLFGTRFKAKLIDSESYYLHLREYIKNNPVKLIRPGYDSKALLYGDIKLTKTEEDFIKNYKFSFFNKPEVEPPIVGG